MMMTPWLALAGRQTLSSTSLHASALANVDCIDKWHNPAAVLYGANDLRFEEFPMPDEVAPSDVQVQMKAVGICGTDVHFLKHVRKHPRPCLPTLGCNVELAFHARTVIRHYVYRVISALRTINEQPA